MKPLLITLAFASAALGGVMVMKRPPSLFELRRAGKPIGPCEPYAEVCRHCSDCSTCQHCAVKGGKCSVCFKK